MVTLDTHATQPCEISQLHADLLHLSLLVLTTHQFATPDASSHQASKLASNRCR